VGKLLGEKNVGYLDYLLRPELKASIILVQRRVWDIKKRLLASIDRAKDLLGYQPKMNFDGGLKAIVD